MALTYSKKRSLPNEAKHQCLGIFGVCMFNYRLLTKYWENMPPQGYCSINGILHLQNLLQLNDLRQTYFPICSQ